MSEPAHAPINVRDLETTARARLAPEVFDYICGGSDDERSLAENVAAFGRIRLRPRVLVDVSRCDTKTTVLGVDVRAPILVAPVAYQGLVHREAERATAEAAARAECIMVLSTMSSLSLEEVARVPGPKWFQLYVFKDRALTDDLVRRARDAGYGALVVTVDAARLGRRERDVRNEFRLPEGVRAGNLPSDHVALLQGPGSAASAIAAHARATLDDALTWERLAALKAEAGMPLVVKGLLTAEDARLAAEIGAAAIVVSNHGGRQLDGTVAPVEALPAIVAAVGDRCEILVDGGVRRGTDVLKAVALGARAVLVGRPTVWALAWAGADGVQRMLGMLCEELEAAMALSGRPSIADVDRSLIYCPPM